METTTTARLGIDIGKVIIDGPAHLHGGDTAFFQGDTATYLATPAMAGSFAAITRLAEHFDGRVWIVSKCGARIEDRSRRWLDHHDFFGRTGIDPEHLRFCRQRHDKAVHAAELRLTHFVDDRPDVLSHLAGIVTHRFLFGRQHQPTADGLIPVADWAEAQQAITARLACSTTDPPG
jgi:5'(3')-deoxyribonucleotidase